MLSILVPRKILHNTARLFSTKLNFDRQTIVDCEGYWATSSDPTRDIYRDRYPFPKSNPQMWPTQEQFMSKLSALEADIHSKKVTNIKTMYFKGVSHSRFDDSRLGCSEYRDQKNSVAWTDAFLNHYVKKYNVKPSKQFYDYVMLRASR